MGAPIIIDGSSKLWVSNGAKDLFCEIVVKAAKLRDLDVSAVLDDAPGIAGTFGVSGVGIDAAEFYPYFAGRQNFREHLDFCTSRMTELCDMDRTRAGTMTHVFAWAKYIMDGGRIDDDAQADFYHSWPPGYEAD